jgi:hypothetical protein
MEGMTAPATQSRFDSATAPPPAQILATFQRDGFYIDRAVFTADELAALRRHAREIQRIAREQLPDGVRYWFGRGRRSDDCPREERSRASWGINEITRPSLVRPAIVDVLGHPRVDAIMQALLDQPRAWGLKILWTPKLVGYDLGWHRDQMKAALYDYVHYKPAAQDHVQFNAALNQDRCFLVVPGSHRRPLTAIEWRALREQPNAALPGEVVAELAPGDILYMDAHTLHRGRSAVEEDRLTLHYSAQAQWVPLFPWGRPEDFAFIQSDAFIQQLTPTARPYYERLRTAVRTDEPMGFLKEAARAQGWKQPAADVAVID